MTSVVRGFRKDLRTNGGPYSRLMPYVMTVRMKSGATAVQVVWSSRRGALERSSTWDRRITRPNWSPRRPTVTPASYPTPKRLSALRGKVAAQSGYREVI